MLNITENNSYTFSVSSRESFSYKLDFENQEVIFVYICNTDNYTYKEKHGFFDYDIPKGFGRIDPGDYDHLVILIDNSITKYLFTNIISGSVRRAWTKFKDELISIYNALVMSQNYRIL